MPNPGLAMYAIKEILRLKYEAQLSQHQIAHSLGLSVGSVSKYLKLAQAQGLRWPLPAELSEAALAQRLGLGSDPAHVAAPPLEFATIHRELQQKGVTRLLLWEEYAATTTEPLSYTRFCVLYRAWKQQLKPTLRQTHIAGDKLFLDYCGATVDIVDATTGELRIEVFQHGQRLAVHPRSDRKGRHTTVPEHLPKAHQAHLEWSPTRFLQWAAEIGPATAQIVQYLLEHRAHPEMGYRSCLGLLGLARRFTAPRLEAACQRAVALGALTRRSVASILAQGLDSQPLPAPPCQLALPAHENLRGASYYQ